MLVDEHDLAAIDRAAQRRVDLERQALGKHAGLRERLVGVVPERCPGDQRDLHWVGLCPLRQRNRHVLGVAGAGEGACPGDSRARFALDSKCIDPSVTFPIY